MTGSMNSKFVSAGSSQDAAEAKSGVGEEDEEVKDAKKAAKMKMYGKLTRERVEWHPAKILCIRFAQQPTLLRVFIASFIGCVSWGPIHKEYFLLEERFENLLQISTF